MTLTADYQARINKTGGRLSRALHRLDPPMSKSLRQMIVALTKHGLQRRFMGDRYMHPGLKKIAEWGQCSKRQARTNMRTLEALRIIIPIMNQKGGRYYATVYALNGEAVIQFLIQNGANPSMKMVSDFRELITQSEHHETREKEEEKAEEKGGRKGGKTSARIRIPNLALAEDGSNVVSLCQKGRVR